jgi:glycerophosphoryl diester phosphodiesterase
MQLVGHRGSSYDLPENTMISFRQAWEEGCDAIELDVHLTSDGRIAVIHDDNALRTTGHDLPIAHTTMTELKRLDAGSWKSPLYRGEAIPELDEVLASGPAHARFFIEVKCGPEILPALKRSLDKNGAGDYTKYILLSFNPEVLGHARRVIPGLKRLWNVEIVQQATDGHPSAAEVVRTAREMQLDAVGLGFLPRPDQSFIRTVQQAGLEIFIWTIDDPVDAWNMQELGIDALASNRPGWIRKQLRGVRDNA